MFEVSNSNSYSRSSQNMLVQNKSKVMAMSNVGIQKEQAPVKWRIVRRYKSDFSMEEVIERLISIHINTKEEG